MAELTHKTTPQKKETVKKIVDLLNEYPIIGAVNMENLPTPQLQRMKSQLRGKVVLLMTKKRLITRALDKKKELSELKKYLIGMPALLFTKENPFSLFKTIKKSKSPAPAKAGQIAPKDLVIPEGPTPFAPGPIIGELGALGIKAGVEGGKVAVKEPCTICKEGEPITEKVAGLLLRFGIEPMEVGLNIIAVYEKGTIYSKKVLDIDEEKFMQDLMTALSEAKNLAMEAAYFSDDTTEDLVQKAFREAKAVALEANFLSDAVVEELLTKAEREMLSLKETIGELKTPEPKAEPEKPKAAEKPKPVEEKKVEPAKPKIEVKQKPVEEKKPEPVVEKKPEPPKVEAPKPKIEEKKAEPPKPKVEEKKVEIPKPEPVKPKVEEVKKIKEPAKVEAPKTIEKKIEKPKVEEKAVEKDIHKKAEEIAEKLRKKAAETGKPVTERIIPDFKEEIKPVEKIIKPKEEVKEKPKEEFMKPVEEMLEKKTVEAKKEPLIRPVDDLIKKAEKKQEEIQKDIAKEEDMIKKAEKIFDQLSKKAAATGEPVKERIIQDVKPAPEPKKEKIEKEKRDKKEQSEVEDLTKELVRKGTLRKDKRK